MTSLLPSPLPADWACSTPPLASTPSPACSTLPLASFGLRRRLLATALERPAARPASGSERVSLRTTRHSSVMVKP